MYFSSYGPLTFTLKSAKNAKFAVEYILRWNKSNLNTPWETILALDNCPGKMNSEVISEFQVNPRPNQDMVGSEKNIAEHEHVSNSFLESILPDGK